MALDLLLSPIKINNLEIKNRIVRPAHGTYYGGGGITDRLIAYHEARARSGVGLSMLEATPVHRSTFLPTIWAWDDSIIPGFQSIAKAVHTHGMGLFTQLFHGGHHWPPLDGSRGWSASTVPSPFGHVPLAMSADQIGEIVEAFAAAAMRARAGGLDGVELHFGHGYLLHQFLSPLTNQRTDEYGGSLENRMRICRETLVAVRKAVGLDYPVGIRISDQHFPGGLSIEDCTEVVRQFSSEALIDFVNASTGSYHSVHVMVPVMDQPPGAMLPAAAPIAAGADGSRVVRMVAGRYRTLEEADQTLREGVADMVGMVRAMIADPELIPKTLAGNVERVRPCIGCNQGVFPSGATAATMGCTVNTAVGAERTLSEDLIERTSRPMKVVVVGGGPSGMEAARMAALAGHAVVLFEADRRLGGAINVARRAPKLQGIGDIVYWLEREIYRLGVDVRLSTFAQADEILAERPSKVIIATGSIPKMDGAQASGVTASGVDQSHVYSSHEIFDVPVSVLGKTALVYDDVGHYEAVAVAEHLIEQGLAVTFVTRHSSMAPLMLTTTRAHTALTRLSEGNFSRYFDARLREIQKGACEISISDSTKLIAVPADLVVLVTSNRSNSEIALELEGRVDRNSGMKLIVTGDALSPRDLTSAIHEGHLAGRFLGDPAH